MVKAMLAALLLAFCSLLATPARADSDPYFVEISTVGASTMTTVGTSPTTGQHVFKFYALQVKGVGAAATTWNVTIDGSLDGTNYTALLTHASGTNADGAVVTSSASAVMPVVYIRAKINDLARGSATGLSVKAIGSQ